MGAPEGGRLTVRVLVTGAGGQLGTDLAAAFTGDDLVAATRQQLDVADRDSVLQAVTTVRPDVIVHAGAWTAVDACESDPDRAFAVNALGTRHVAEGARLTGARVLYVSTDYVFDGTSPTPYTEWHEPNPLSVYGRSKLAGERELDAGSTIVRVSWVCGPHGSNMVKTILRLAAEHEQLSFVDDQHGCPTFTGDLAEMIRHLAVARLPGTFHVTNQGPTTWFGLARAVLDAAGMDPERVRPIRTADMPRPAPRPANSVLDNAALRLMGIPLLPDWHEPLERTVKELLAS
ncbi:MAG TPA: dTDP-4-dehydrorhamnose reductase [Acidimicrobiales bacterium]|nr:dTDP-4-dehydrorhamnose reductase [Acidimicrobiales bacterium]